MRNHGKKYEEGIRKNAHETTKELQCEIQGGKKFTANQRQWQIL